MKNMTISFNGVTYTFAVKNSKSVDEIITTAVSAGSLIPVSKTATTTTTTTKKAKKAKVTANTERANTPEDIALKAAVKTASQSLSLAGTEIQKADAADTMARKSHERKTEKVATSQPKAETVKKAATPTHTSVCVKLAYDTNGVHVVNMDGSSIKDAAVRQCANDILKSSGFIWHSENMGRKMVNCGWVLVHDGKRFPKKEAAIVNANPDGIVINGEAIVAKKAALAKYNR